MFKLAFINGVFYHTSNTAECLKYFSEHINCRHKLYQWLSWYINVGKVTMLRAGLAPLRDTTLEQSQVFGQTLSLVPRRPRHPNHTMGNKLTKNHMWQVIFMTVITGILLCDVCYGTSRYWRHFLTYCTHSNHNLFHISQYKFNTILTLFIHVSRSSARTFKHHGSWGFFTKPQKVLQIVLKLNGKKHNGRLFQLSQQNFSIHSTGSTVWFLYSLLSVSFY